MLFKVYLIKLLRLTTATTMLNVLGNEMKNRDLYLNQLIYYLDKPLIHDYRIKKKCFETFLIFPNCFSVKISPNLSSR